VKFLVKFFTELSGEKKKIKALEEKLEAETVEKGKLAEKLKFTKDQKKFNEISEENVQLKVKLDIVNDEFKEQMDALRKNMEHMFQENQNLKEENRSLKLAQSQDSNAFSSPVATESSLGQAEGKDSNEPANAQGGGKRSRKNSKRRGSKGLAAEERQELQTKILLLSSEAEELRSANADLEKKVESLSANQKVVDSERAELQKVNKDLQTECISVSLSNFTIFF
jgi:DNA repair exonuclease SbcCD ATPase subunit